MNRNELVAGVAQKAGIPRNQAEKVLDALGDVVTEAVHKGDKVSLTAPLDPGQLLRPLVVRKPPQGRCPGRPPHCLLTWLLRRRQEPDAVALTFVDRVLDRLGRR